MRKAPAAAPKPKPRARAKPKAKASPDSLSSATSPSRSGGSPVAVGRGLLSPSSPTTPKARSPLSPFAASTPASVSTVADLRGRAASSLDSLKRRLDALHGDSARDLEASHSRISKRIKTQSCLKLAEEAEKERKKMDERISGRAEEMKASYKEFVTEVQSSSSRVSKVTFPEMAKSVARAIDGMRSRYNIPATTA
ncbi:uncharacterized protein LOC119285814 isoform X2 [Triticum dicoccoides]|uniref:uncharacterized protein LOC119285814 isoform X2 n=1 Tax=Triticum dicoccoides TaxID=85692 RepID=UPI00162BAE1C|nr:uncharacterized protein LOC119285814 isoform X2 [Triticum dicoccoides]XP_044441832.1 uncharacterized protein LOC123167951 isoform X2 [Triticum aestivum]